jgi:hypothetical protein
LGLGVRAIVAFRWNQKSKVTNNINMKTGKLKLAIMAGALGLAVQAHASLFDITFSGGGISASGEIDQGTSLGGGLYQATSGSFTISLLGSTDVFQLDPVPAGSQYFTVHGVPDTGGADLYGDNILGLNYISGNGLMFTFPGVGVNGGSIPTQDVINLWGNGGGSYTLAYGGPDFSPGLHMVTAEGTVTAVPEPTTLISGALLLLPFGASTLRILRKRQGA